MAALPVSPDGVMSTAEVNRQIDVAEQLTTIMVAAGRHEATTAALRSALDMYQTSVEMLTRAVNDELRAVASRHMRAKFGNPLAGITLQPTELVDETFIKLIKQRQKYDNRGHFFAIATKLLLRVLGDYHRRRMTKKRGFGWVRVPLDAERPGTASPAAPPTTLELSNAIMKLEEFDKRKADVVRYRVVWGLTIAETAAALDLEHATIERDWAFARAWLANELPGTSA